MSVDTTSMAEPMATILDTFAGVNALRQLEADTRRDDLVDLLERHAEHTDENGHVWIDVQVAVDLLLDNTELAALIRPESIRSARKEQ